MKECDLEKKYVDAIESIGGLGIKLYGEGLPDRLFIFPSGRQCFVEFKSNKGRLSSSQKDIHLQFDKLHQTILTIKNKSSDTDLENFINKFNCIF